MILPGEPMTSEPSGITLPSPISELAPMMQYLPIVAPLRITELMPISVLSSTVQPCSMTLWPMVTFLPMVSGEPMSVCITVPSWTLLFSPMSISSLSPRNTAPTQTLALACSLILPMRVAVGAIQLCGWASTRESPRRYFILFSSWLGSAAVGRALGSRWVKRRLSGLERVDDRAFGRLVQTDIAVEQDVHQLNDHDRRQAPDLVLAKAVTGDVPTAALIVDAVRMLTGVLAEKLQRDAEHGSDFAIIGPVFDKIGNDAHVRRDLDPVLGDQRTQRAHHLDQSRRQAYLLLGLAQCGEHQIRVFGVASPAGERHFATMSRQPAGAQGQHQLGLVAAGDRQQDCGLGKACVGLKGARRMAAYTAK